MKNTKTIIGVVLLIAILVVAVGYAAISNVLLQINGQASATTSDANFTVEFIGTPVTDNAEVPGAVVAADITDEHNATIDVSGLSENGDVVTATYQIKNTSADLTASLLDTVTYSNHDFFEVTSEIAEPTLKLAAGETTTIKLTVKLIQTPIDADVSTTINVKIDATPVQPQA